MKLNSSDNATVVTVVQTLKWLRNIWTEREEKFEAAMMTTPLGWLNDYTLAPG